MRRRLRYLVAVMVMAAVIAPASPVRAQTTYDVTVGRFDEKLPLELMGFFPSALRVHEGDLIHFSIGFHTATLLPAGETPETWRPERAEPFGNDPWTFAPQDEDDGDDAYKINTRAFLPSRLDCGAPDQDPCAFDGSPVPGSPCPELQQYLCLDGVLNSGPAEEEELDFTVEITAAAGETLWAVCLVHPAMTLRIDVVGASEPASDPAAIAAAVAKRQATATRAAAATHRQLSTMPVRAPKAGTTVWDAFVGADGPDFSLFAMYPRTLAIRRGDVVRFHFDRLRYELHTASVPLAPALEISNTFLELQCDLDGDSGPLPDIDPPFPDFPFCPAGPLQIEFDLVHDLPVIVGDGVYTGEAEDLESSGWRGPEGLYGTDSFDVRFDAPSPAGGFTYVCMIHPFMRGKIVVR